MYNNIIKIRYPEIGLTMIGRYSADFETLNIGDTIVAEPILFYGTKDGKLTWYKRDSISRKKTDINLKFIFKLNSIDELVDFEIPISAGKRVKVKGKIGHHLIDRTD